MTTATPSVHSEGKLLDDGHMQRWLGDGYVVVEGWLDEAELARARGALDRLLPDWLDNPGPDDRDSVQFHFPYDADELNAFTVHPELLSFAERALKSEHVTLARSSIWCKRSGGDDWAGRAFDQPLHTDYHNNTLVVPNPADLDQLAAIGYYTDVTLDLGPTYIVSFGDSEAWQNGNFYTPDTAPELFEHERPITVPAGSILLYTMRTFHRGSRFRTTEGIRVSHHIAFHRANSTWVCRHTPASETVERIGEFLSPLSPKQRSALGFPAPGDPYWTPETIVAVGRRYLDMDLSPYKRQQ